MSERLGLALDKALEAIKDNQPRSPEVLRSQLRNATAKAREEREPEVMVELTHTVAYCVAGPGYVDSHETSAS